MKQIIEIKPKSSDKVLSGDKVITIQKGRRLYNLGDAVLLDPEDNKTISIEILRVSYCKVKDTPIMDLALHGEKKWENLVDYLKQYYPTIKKDSVITIIRFQLKKDNK